MKKWLSIAIGLLFLLLMIWSKQPETEKTILASQEEQHLQAADFALKTLEGKTIRMSDIKEKKIILNFWTSWCEPCKEEMPLLLNFYKAHQKEVEILAVNITSDDYLKNVREFVEQEQLTFPILLDETGEISKKYKILTIPTSIIINEQGEIIQQIVGPLNEAILNELIDTI